MAKEVIDTQGGTCAGCKNCGMGCTCGGMHGYHGHPLLRILLALVLLGFVFAAGMKLGELKAELGLGYEHHMMDGGRHSFDMYGQGGGWAMPMMGTTIVAPTTSAPSAPATTTATPSSKK